MNHACWLAAPMPLISWNDILLSTVYNNMIIRIILEVNDKHIVQIFSSKNDVQSFQNGVFVKTPSTVL